MKRFYFLTVALFVTANFLFAKGRSMDLDYIIQRKDSTSLLITVSFKGNIAGQTVLHLPNEWAGQKMLYKAVSMLRGISKSTFIDTTSSPENYLVRYRPGSKVTISYLLKQGWSGPLRYPFYFHPVISNKLFYFEGYSAFVYPEMADQQIINCRVSYKGFSKEFEGSSFFANKHSGIFSCNIRNLMNSFFCAGSFDSKTVNIEGHHIIMAIYGKFSYTNKEAFSSISKIIMAERKFWSDPGSNCFFTLIMPTDDKGNYGGTAHFNSFSLFQSSDVQLNNGILQTISHEYFHNWIGSSGLKNPSPDEAYKWFSEGFTDYYSLKLLNKTGGITNADLIKKLNEDIREYYLSPHFNADSLSIIGKYWTDADWRQLPYRRGLTIALTLDLKIREKNPSLSLDDLMKKLYEQSKPSLFFSTSLFEKLVVKYAGQETLDEVHGALLGKNELLTNALLGNKIYKTGQLRIYQIFDVGFDMAASMKEKKIVGLKPGSNAEKAGLREDMPITGLVAGLRNNNTEMPGKVEIILNNKKEWISFIPVAIVDLQVPQLDL